MRASRSPFSVEVSSGPWLASAESWVAAALEPLGVQVTGVEQRRVRPWSTQLVIDAAPAGGGLPGRPSRSWFKANCRAQAFEPALQAFLADLLPDAVSAPLAIDAQRAWMLTADHGATLRDARGDAGPTPADWVAVVDEWVRIQFALAERGPEVVALGVPDCAPATVPARFDRMLAHVVDLPSRHPSAPDAETAAALAAARARVVAAAEVLDASGLPATLQHGDLHPGNVFAASPGEPGRLRVFDFGDAQWAHPVEALLTPVAVMGYSELDSATLVRAFRDAWAPVASFDNDEWAALEAAASVTHAVNRAYTWAGCLADATEAETAEWGEAILHHLSGVLESEPR